MDPKIQSVAAIREVAEQRMNKVEQGLAVGSQNLQHLRGTCHPLQDTKCYKHVRRPANTLRVGRVLAAFSRCKRWVGAIPETKGTQE